MKVFTLLTAPLLASASPLLAERQADRSIDALYKGVGKLYFGAATEKAKILTDRTEAIVQQNFGQVTPEYSMKWDATEPNRNQFTLDTADQLVQWAVSNQKSIRGHTLVWHESLPQWVKDITDPNDMKAVLENHIAVVVGKWKGQIRAWDVVNEIFDSEAGTLRQNVFLQVLGEDYVGIAFRAANAADPSAKLYINDYNINNVEWGSPKKLPALVEKVRQWKEQGIPIHGIGSQTHLEPGNSAAVETAMRTLATVVEEVAITELDIVGSDPQEYRQVAEACYHVPTCVGITIWGVSDEGEDKTLFKQNQDPKDAYYAIADWLKTLQ